MCNMTSSRPESNVSSHLLSRRHCQNPLISRLGLEWTWHLRPTPQRNQLLYASRNIAQSQSPHAAPQYAISWFCWRESLQRAVEQRISACWSSWWLQGWVFIRHQMYSWVFLNKIVDIFKVPSGLAATDWFMLIPGSVIANVSCSTLFIHGEADGLIPVDHSLSLFKRCHSSGVESQNRGFIGAAGCTEF